MPVSSVIAVIGGIALLVGLLGGGIEAKEIKVPKMPLWSRFLSGLVGIVLIGIAIWLSYLRPSGQLPEATAQFAAAITPDTPTATPILPTNTPIAPADTQSLPPTLTLTPTPTATPTNTLTLTPTLAAIPSNTPTLTPTLTAIPSNTPTLTPTLTTTPVVCPRVSVGSRSPHTIIQGVSYSLGGPPQAASNEEVLIVRPGETISLVDLQYCSDVAGSSWDKVQGEAYLRKNGDFDYYDGRFTTGAPIQAGEYQPIGAFEGSWTIQSGLDRLVIALVHYYQGGNEVDGRFFINLVVQ